ncbi:MAG TPA: hypothetical protein PKZ28_12150, partial [Piscinibacter sp.]|nr:hypothetical protein [Piscinibacter sp.]
MEIALFGSRWAGRLTVVTVDAGVAARGCSRRRRRGGAGGRRTVGFRQVCSWGEYYDYFHGRWDGRNHEDEIQTLASGERMAHPGGGGGYYMCPTESFGEFLWEGVRRGL